MNDLEYDEYDDLNICEICEDRYATGSICYECARQQAIDNDEQPMTPDEIEWLSVSPSDDPIWD